MKIARRVAFVFLVVFLEFVVVHARSSGAPVDSNPGVCVDLTPGHQLPRQMIKSPYSIVPSSMKYMPGEEFTVTVNAPESTNFKGIFMQMRRNDTNAIVGTWSVSDAQNFKTVSCAGVDNNVVTHKNSQGKGMSNTFKWTAPENTDADVYVAATFVKDYGTFWVNQTSSTITAMTAVSSCTDNSCANGATCNGGLGEGAYTCTCPADYTGPLCETSLATTARTTTAEGTKVTCNLFMISTAMFMSINAM